MAIQPGSRPITRQSSLSLPHTRATSTSAASHTARCSTSSEAEADADVSSDEDGGVFFGLHTSIEAQTVAKLSFHSSTPPPSPKRVPKRTPHISRVTKRDSREFLRRKTLLLPAGNNQEAESRVKSSKSDGKEGYRELQQRQSDGESDLQSPLPLPLGQFTPLQADSTSDLALLFTQFKVSGLAPANAAPESASESEDSLSDSDKENMAERSSSQPLETSPDNMYRGESTVLRGLLSNVEDQGTDEEIEHINRGGLRMSDFSDPETGLGYDLDRQSDGLGSDDIEDTDSVEESDVTARNLGTSVPDETLNRVAERPMDANEEHSDSPLPIARGGPVIIPNLPHHLSIRAESGSPFRSLPYCPPRQPDPEFAAVEVDEKIRTREVDSPTPQMSRPLAFVSLAPSTITLSGTTPTDTNQAVTWNPDLRKSALSLAPSAAVQSQKMRKPFPTAEKAAIRGHLDAAFASKMRTFGPPQRSVSATSASSSSSTSSSLPGRPNVLAAGSKAPVGVSVGGSTRPPSRPAALQRPPHALVPRPIINSALISSTTLKNIRAPPKLSAAADTSVSRPNPHLIKPIAAPSRPIMFSRPMQGKQVIRAAIGGSRFKRPAPLTERPIIISAPAKVQASPGLNPLKRPLTTVQPAARAAVSTGSQASRLLSGLPCRIPDLTLPPFTFGIASDPGCMPPVRAVLKSPGRGFFQGRETTLATPLRIPGTPGRLTMGHTVSDVSSTPSRFLHQTAQVDQVQSTEQRSTPPRGSSQDHEDVSIQLADSLLPSSSSPMTEHNLRSTEKTPSPQHRHGKEESENITPSGRPKRRVKPPQTRPEPPHAREPGSVTMPTIVPNMSEKELKMTTHRNTKRNEVYHCAIDRQIVRIPGTRPPSPSSKIRTIADRDEAERKSGRGQRARRRAKESEDETDDEPLVEYVIQKKGPGDEEDWATPARPVKKAKTLHAGKAEKSVRWDKGLVLIRDQGDDASEIDSSEGKQPGRTALRDGEVQLDQHGNIIDSTRPKENLKRGRIVVTAVFYDGEEPYHIPPPYVSNNGGSASNSRTSKKGA